MNLDGNEVKKPSEEIRASAGLLLRYIAPREWKDEKGKKVSAKRWPTRRDIEFIAGDLQRIAAKVEALELREQIQSAEGTSYEDNHG